MKIQESIDFLKSRRTVQQLHNLLSDPEPGLMSWCELYCGALRDLSVDISKVVGPEIAKELLEISQLKKFGEQ